MPVVTAGFPTVESWANLTRVYVNDTFKGATGKAGEGRIFTDDSPFILPILNAALSKFQRELDSHSIPTKINETVLYNVPALNSTLGSGTPNPAVQQNLSYTGFFDGYSNHATPVLPSDFLVPKRMWQRQSNSGLTFTDFSPAADGLQSFFQDYSLGSWDWRGEAIYWNGSLVQMDIRMRYVSQIGYYGSVDPADFSTTPLPFRECVDVLAYMGAEEFCASRLPDGATAGLQAKIRKEMDKYLNREIKKMQGTRYSREAYGETGDIFTW